MEAQVENNVKTKKRKKKHICTDFNHWKIAEVEKNNIGKKELTLNWCPWPNTQALLYLVPSKELFLILSGLIRHK